MVGSMASPTPTLVDALVAIVGSAHVLTDPDATAAYGTDWTGRYHGAVTCVVRPGSTNQVVAAIRACHAHRHPIVPQGGNTGLVGGSVPGPEGAVVLSTLRLTHLGAVDTLARAVTAGAGVTIAALGEAARRAGLDYGVDLASRESATVGGTIATNAGGIRTIQYGTTRAQLLGIEAVLADGSVLTRLGGVGADNTGYDLTQLLAGSEGTLGVVTAARLRLVHPDPPGATVLVPVAGPGAAVELLGRMRGQGARVLAAELMEPAGIALVRDRTGLGAPLPGEPRSYLLCDLAADEAALERLAALPALDGAAVAMDPGHRSALWAYRERHTDAISAVGIPHKLDISLPLGALDAFRSELDGAISGAVAGTACQVVVFGHIGVGNLHVNLIGPAEDDDRADQAVLSLAVAHGGTISAEHGIGRAKRRYLRLDRSGAEIAAMTALKQALDPQGILNPGVLVG